MIKFLSFVLVALVFGHASMTEFSAYQMCSTVQSLASSNADLNARVERARNIVRALKDTNTQLKVSVSTGVTMLQEEIEENNKLNLQLDTLTWQVKLLESLLGDRNAPAP